MKRFLPRTVVILGMVSFMNDFASEMVTPLLPVFLTLALGAGPAVVGLVEGVAEATASMLKLAAGWLADRGWNAKRMVVGGYGLSNAARPLIGAAFGWTMVLSLRFIDRVGKGIRTAPRDAMIAQATASMNLGRAFGFHRSMDHAGSVLGPLVAFVLLSSHVEIREIFYLSVIPGVLVLALLYFGLPAEQVTPQRPAQVTLRWSLLDRRLKGLIVASGGLALATTPEAFLILWAQTRGMDIAHIPLVWAAASAVKMFVVLPAGALSDRAGRIPVVATGWGLRIMLLAALAFAGDSAWVVWTLFLAYAGSLALTEAAERSLVGEFSPRDRRGTVFGIYHLVTGLFALPGAILFGVIWQWLGQRTAFLVAAVLTVIAASALLAIGVSGRQAESGSAKDPLRG